MAIDMVKLAYNICRPLGHDPVEADLSRHLDDIDEADAKEAHKEGWVAERAAELLAPEEKLETIHEHLTQEEWDEYSRFILLAAIQKDSFMLAFFLRGQAEVLAGHQYDAIDWRKEKEDQNV